MRLIDADALKEQVESHVVSMSVCLSMDEHYGKVTMREDCLEDTTNAPTIDAIPVEWLEVHKTEYLDDWGEEPITVEEALKMWKKEQEVHQ
jgi:hypothetical protein